MRIVIVTDAWYPQVNGVVRTLTATRDHLEALGHQVFIIGPDHTAFRTVPCPTYPEINLALNAATRVSQLIEDFGPDCLHIATEGPLGWAARWYCRQRELNFTTSFHTRFPEYVHARFRVPHKVTYSYLRRFHRRSHNVMVNTPTMAATLRSHGFDRLSLWTRGVDTDVFRPMPRLVRSTGPIQLYVGRLAVEKNVEAFLKLDTPGQKWVVGDGPAAEELKLRYPDAKFFGFLHGQELVQIFNEADVFVFPSLTDTFGLVMLEALACGTPVAAFPVAGPLDVVDDQVGHLSTCLETAVAQALQKNRQDCRDFARERSWQRSAEQFLNNLSPLSSGRISSRIEKSRGHHSPFAIAQ